VLCWIISSAAFAPLSAGDISGLVNKIYKVAATFFS
jgi:hypothetical protein